MRKPPPTTLAFGSARSASTCLTLPPVVSTSSTTRAPPEGRPEAGRKWPCRTAPVARRRASTSSSGTGATLGQRDRDEAEADRVVADAAQLAQRPVGEHRLAAHGFLRPEAPGARVGAVGAVVAEHEGALFGDDRALVVGARVAGDVGLVEEDAVDVDGAVDDLHRVARPAAEALDKVALRGT